MKKFIIILFISSCCLLANANILRDPTMPAVSESNGTDGKTVALVLSGVVTSSKNNFAIVNGQHVVVGEEVDGAQVVNITKHSVFLKRGGQIQELTLVPSIASVSQKETDK